MIRRRSVEADTSREVNGLEGPLTQGGTPDEGEGTGLEKIGALGGALTQEGAG